MTLTTYQWLKKGIVLATGRRTNRLWIYGPLLLSVIVLSLLTGCLAQARPPVGSAASGVTPFKFAVFCDTRSDAQNSGLNGVNVSAIKAISKHLKEQGAEFVLAPGDLICGNVSWYAPAPPANAAQYSAFLEAAASQGVGLPGGPAPVPLYAVRGNHESYHDIMSKEEVKQAWLTSIGHALPGNGPAGEAGFTYSFTRHNILFIGLDEYQRASDDEKTGITFDTKWLLEQVKAQPDAKSVFVFGHTPAYSANHQDCLDDDKAARDELMTVVHNKGGVYFCGHDHFYARAGAPVYDGDGRTIQGYAEQIITSSGAPFLTGSRSDNHKWNGKYADRDVLPRAYIDNSIGYQLVTVDGDRVTVQFIGTQDGSTYTMNPDGVYTYTYNDNWQQWNFAVMDQFSYQLPAAKPQNQQTERRL